jgi:hypothetical protein
MAQRTGKCLDSRNTVDYSVFLLDFARACHWSTTCCSSFFVCRRLDIVFVLCANSFDGKFVFNDWIILYLAFSLISWSCILASNWLQWNCHFFIVRRQEETFGINLITTCLGATRFMCRSENSPLFTSFYIPTLTGVVLTQYLSTCGFFVLRPFWKTRHLIRIVTCGTLALWIYVPLYDRYLVCLFFVRL